MKCFCRERTIVSELRDSQPQQHRVEWGSDHSLSVVLLFPSHSTQTECLAQEAVNVIQQLHT